MSCQHHCRGASGFTLIELLVVLGILSVMARLIAYLFGGLEQKTTGLDLGHVELEA